MSIVRRGSVSGVNPFRNRSTDVYIPTVQFVGITFLQHSRALCFACARSHRRGQRSLAYGVR
eukprot:5652281-Prymnesium_polylepis.1